MKKGFTVIELIIVMVVIGILAAISAPLIDQAARSAGMIYDVSDVSAQGKTSFTQFLRALRSVQSISAMTSSSLSYTDIDHKNIAITYSSNVIYRSENGGTARSWLTDVDSLSLTYQDSAGATTATPANVRYVTVNIGLNKNGSTQTLKETVYLPNNG